jgi:hypothetical protein
MAKDAKHRKEIAAPQEEPVIVSLSLARVPDGWSVITLWTQGDRVVKREATTPDMMAIAKEAFKLKAVKELGL